MIKVSEKSGALMQVNIDSVSFIRSTSGGSVICFNNGHIIEVVEKGNQIEDLIALDNIPTGDKS